MLWYCNNSSSLLKLSVCSRVSFPAASSDLTNSAMVSHAAVEAGRMYLLELVFLSASVRTRQGIAGSHVSSSLPLGRNRHVVFRSGCTSVQRHQRRARLPSSPQPRQRLFFVFYNGHSHRCEATSPCGLICIALTAHGVEHLFMYLLAFCTSSLEKYLFTPSAYFLNGMECF